MLIVRDLNNLEMADGLTARKNNKNIMFGVSREKSGNQEGGNTLQVRCDNRTGIRKMINALGIRK